MNAWKKGIPDIDCLTSLARRGAASLTPPDFHWRSFYILVVSVICGWEETVFTNTPPGSGRFAAGTIGIGIELFLKGHGC
jgi:hypothetical protein